MCWHVENRRPNGIMSYPFDGETWNHLDATYPSVFVIKGYWLVTPLRSPELGSGGGIFPMPDNQHKVRLIFTTKLRPTPSG